MFRKMRREDRQIDHDACIKIVTENNMGILSLNSVDEYPYGVPINYMYRDGYLYFHCAKEGKKIELLSQSSKACFIIVGKSEVIPEKFTNKYQSVMIFADIEIISDNKLKYDILMEFGRSFDFKAAGLEQYVANNIDACLVLKLDTKHMSGKMR